MRKKIHTALFLVMFSLPAFAQVGVNRDSTSADPSAALDVKFTDKGFLPPRMSHAGLDSIDTPAAGLVVYCTDCGTGGTGCLAVFRNGGWNCVQDDCILPAAPGQGNHVTSGTQVTWNWNPVPGASGYKWGTSSAYGSATDMGTATSKQETGLQCNTAYTRYVWAYNSCGKSDSTVLTATTPSCSWSCGQTITDSRDSKVYGTVLIGTQCWMSQNLNVGSKIDNTSEQSNNSILEKYCYNNADANCTTYGGLYQWAEMVQYYNGATNTTSWSPQPTGTLQGICPSGWHIPTWAEWTTLSNGLYPDSGGKMKEAGFTHWASPNTGATNSSGFTALPGGSRMSDGQFVNLTHDATFWGLDEFLEPDKAAGTYLLYNSSSHNLTFLQKASGLSVRCLKN